MAWEITWTRKCTSFVRWRMQFFLGYIKLRTGVTIVAIHTMIQGSLLFLPLFGQTETPPKRIFCMPNESRLLSGLLATPLLLTGASLVYAAIKPRIGLLDGYIVGTQCIIIAFPVIFAVIYMRTFTETTHNTKDAKMIFPGRGSDVTDREIFVIFTYLYLSLTYALVSYLFLFYNVVLVLSFKDELIRKRHGGRRSECFAVGSYKL